jgi:hypothetical protein
MHAYYNNGMFTRCHNLKMLDISNFVHKWQVAYFIYGCRSLTDLGMVHCNVDSINAVVEKIHEDYYSHDMNITTTVWIGSHLTAEDIASLVQYDHIVYKIQEEQAVRLLLNSPHLENDEIKVIDGQLCNVHNMGMIVLDGVTERWGNVPTANGRRYSCTTYDDIVKLGGKLICSEFKQVNICVGGEDNVISCNTHPPYSTLYVSFNAVKDINEFKAWLTKNPVKVVFELAEPYTEVIDLPRANVNIPLYENGVLYMSDPTASIVREESDTNLIINYIQGDSIVNVSNQQLPIELSEENDNCIPIGEIT